MVGLTKGLYAPSGTLIVRGSTRRCRLRRPEKRLTIAAAVKKFGDEEARQRSGLWAAQVGGGGLKGGTRSSFPNVWMGLGGLVRLSPEILKVHRWETKEAMTG